MHAFTTIRIQHQRLRFLLLFVTGVGLLAAIFSQWQFLFDRIYLHPVSYAAATVLDLVGVGIRLDTSSLPLGFCLLIFDKITFRIIHECTGIFALLIFLVAVLVVHPTSSASISGNSTP